MEENQLISFRKQWQEELEHQNGGGERRASNADISEVENKLEQLQIESDAESFFRQAIDLERKGKVFDAIPLYRKAVHLVPDIEYKIHDLTKANEPARSHKTQIKDDPPVQGHFDEDEDHLDDTEDLYARFTDSLHEAGGGRWCQNFTTTPSTHISDLPFEVLLIITRWIVSDDLDIQALEKCALVSKGFYLHARDPKLWRVICLKVWGANQLGCLADSAFSSWRQMYFERSRLRFLGCYISKTEYFRLGENSFQDAAYKPVHHVEYYRYLRFFPDGHCLMLTTADEPHTGVKKLKVKHTRRKDVMKGYFRLHNDMVTIMLQRQLTVEVPVIHDKRGRAPPPQSMAYSQTFHVELQVISCHKKRFNQLQWKQYRIIQHRNGTESTTEFPLDKAKYPPFNFSKVELYSQETNSVLTT